MLNTGFGLDFPGNPLVECCQLERLGSGVLDQHARDRSQMARLRLVGPGQVVGAEGRFSPYIAPAKQRNNQVGTIERGRGAKGDRLRAEVLKRNLPFSISELEEACPGVSRDMVRLVLHAMKAEGLIAPTGKGRGARWIGLDQRPPTRE